MEVLNGLLVGIGAGVFVTWFPGMLNMQVVATACRAGRSKAYAFSAGLSTVIGLQATLAVFFAHLITGNVFILKGIKQWAIPLFLVLAVVFIAKGFSARAARRAEIEQPYPGGPFWRGFVSSAMNVLNIPFFLAIVGWLLSTGYLTRSFVPRVMFILGTGAGTLGVFFLYARLSGWISDHAAFFTRNINFFLGGLFVVLAAIQAVRIMEV